MERHKRVCEIMILISILLNLIMEIQEQIKDFPTCVFNS